MRFLTCLCLTATCVAGYATTLDVELREKIVGSWFLDISVLGRRTQEVITFNADGTYTARLLFSEHSDCRFPTFERSTWPVDGGEYEVGPVESMYALFERGTWLVEGGEYQFEAVESTYPPLRRQRRRIVTLDDSELLGVDSQFGIEIRRKRVPDDFAFLPTGDGQCPGR